MIFSHMLFYVYVNVHHQLTRVSAVPSIKYNARPNAIQTYVGSAYTTIQHALLHAVKNCVKRKNRIEAQILKFVIF